MIIRTGSRQLNFVSTWNVVAPELGVGGVGSPVAAGVGVGASVAAGVGVGAPVAAGVGVPSSADDDVAGVTAELPAGYVPQPPRETTLRRIAAIIRARTLVKRSGGQPVTDARLEAGRMYS
jgi:hypothetical protein